MHGSLVTSSLIRETTENESANEGYRFGQEEETYNIVGKNVEEEQFSQEKEAARVQSPKRERVTGQEDQEASCQQE
jgi:hypothetical protein